jgi:hypothetical protein
LPAPIGPAPTKRTPLGLTDEERAAIAEHARLIAEEREKARNAINRETIIGESEDPEQNKNAMAYWLGLTPDLAKNAEDALKKIMDALKPTAMQEQLMYWRDDMTSAFADFASGCRSAAEAFHDFALSVIRDLAAMAARQYITGPLFDWLARSVFNTEMPRGTPAPDYGGYAGSYGGPQVQIFNSSTTSATTSRGPGGNVQVWIESIVDRAIASGRHDRAAGMAWGLSRVPVGR